MPIHSTAIVDPLAEIHPTVSIGPFVVIEKSVVLGPDIQVAAHAVILNGTEIGRGTCVHSHAVIGGVPQDRAFTGEVSYVKVGEDCVIREGATVHRGTGSQSVTVIGDRCILMTTSHVGHNCVLGNDVTLISGALLGGHVNVGARAMISGNAAVHQFVRIGELAMISGLGKIVQDVPPFFMADREGEIAAVNSVGLRRAGFTDPERADLKKAFRIIYRSGLSWEKILRRLAENVATSPGRQLLEFLSTPSRRGISRGCYRHITSPASTEDPHSAPEAPR